MKAFINEKVLHKGKNSFVILQFQLEKINIDNYESVDEMLKKIKSLTLDCKYLSFKESIILDCRNIQNQLMLCNFDFSFSYLENLEELYIALIYDQIFNGYRNFYIKKEEISSKFNDIILDSGMNFNFINESIFLKINRMEKNYAHK
ncbi:hypothetical protein [Enterococcus sp. AZ163]|uniref:hypothetical protein n=1 Tax=Enterococcus sp. AZ163 TaxID=2774638 RepID=UPI003D2BD3FC